MKKLYMGDRDVPYQGTTIGPLKTKSDIDGVLARWGITKYGWEYNPEKNLVKIMFELPLEKFGDTELAPVVVLEPPRIWNKRTRGKREESINWKVSMRILHWFIKTTLEMSYAMQSQKVVAFLPHIKADDDRTVKDILIPRISILKSLPEHLLEEPEVEIIPPEKKAWHPND